MRVKPVNGHLSSKQKKVIRIMLRQKLNAGRVGRTEYFIKPIPDKPGYFVVRIGMVETTTIGADPKMCWGDTVVNIKFEPQDLLLMGDIVPDFFRFHEIPDGEVLLIDTKKYIADPKQYKLNSTQKSAFMECIKTGDLITMGKTLVEPIW